MRFTTIRTSGGLRAARVEGDQLVLLPFGDVGELLAAGEDWQERGSVDGDRVSLAEADLAPLVPNPEKIFCVGLNYHDHALETGLELPELPDALRQVSARPHRPRRGARDARPDRPGRLRAELGIVVGSAIRHIGVGAHGQSPATRSSTTSSPATGSSHLQYLAGKTFQARPRSASWCHRGRAGPLDEPGDQPHRDGEERCRTPRRPGLRGRRADRRPHRIVPLVPGDLIATGTPSGVGHVMTPPRYMVDGTVVECSIEGLGTQTTHCRAGDRERGIGISRHFVAGLIEKSYRRRSDAFAADRTELGELLVRMQQSRPSRSRWRRRAATDPSWENMSITSRLVSGRAGADEIINLVMASKLNLPRTAFARPSIMMCNGSVPAR